MVGEREIRLDHEEHGMGGVPFMPRGHRTLRYSACSLQPRFGEAVVAVIKFPDFGAMMMAFCLSRPDMGFLLCVKFGTSRGIGTSQLESFASAL